jgi:hypothetical protein
MATLASTVIEQVSLILHDTSNVRWNESELLDWLNLGQNQIVIFKPDSCVTAAEYKLSQGSLQSLPDGSDSFVDAQSETLPAGIQLLDIPMNMGTNGLTPGRSIKLVDKDILDAVDPDWPEVTAAAEVKYVMYDQKTPDIFYTYPPQPSTSQGYVAVIYSSIPTACLNTAATTYIGIPDKYVGALIDYILYRAYSKEMDSVDGTERAVAYYNNFLNAIERQDLQMKLRDPNINSPSASIEKT